MVQSFETYIFQYALIALLTDPMVDSREKVQKYLSDLGEGPLRAVDPCIIEKMIENINVIAKAERIIKTSSNENDDVENTSGDDTLDEDTSDNDIYEKTAKQSSSNKIKDKSVLRH